MTASICTISSFFIAAAVWMLTELRKAPEAIEDESGFRIARQLPVPDTAVPVRAVGHSSRRRPWRTHATMRA
jgi:hypothetical protein